MPLMNLQLPGWYGAHRFHFYPLGEFINRHEEEAVAPLQPRERSQDVQPLDHEGPGERDGLET